jgi:hypothetical protein
VFEVAMIRQTKTLIRIRPPIIIERCGYPQVLRAPKSSKSSLFISKDERKLFGTNCPTRTRDDRKTVKEAGMLYKPSMRAWNIYFKKLFVL